MSILFSEMHKKTHR